MANQVDSNQYYHVSITGLGCCYGAADATFKVGGKNNPKVSIVHALSAVNMMRVVGDADCGGDHTRELRWGARAIHVRGCSVR